MSARPPRICLLTETYYPVVGGGEKQAQSLAEDLSAHGFRTTIVTRRSSPDLERAETMGAVRVVRVPPAGRGGSKRWIMLVPAVLALARLRHEYDLILVSGFKSLGICGAAASLAFGKPCVLKADSNGEMSGEFFAAGLGKLRMTPGSWPFTLLLRGRNRLLRRATAFVAITRGIAREYDAEGIPPERVHHISNSVDTERFHPVPPAEKARIRQRLGLRAEQFLVAYTGRLVSYKGLPLLLRVARALHPDYPSLGFVLIGSGGLDMHNCEAELRREVVAHGLQDVVGFAGEVPNVHEYLQAADGFVLPSEDDAFPLSLIEAMACGLPVIATAVGGIPEIISDGKTGLLIRAGNHAGLEAALVGLLTRQDLRASLGAAARTAVVRRYSRDAVAARYMELFQSCR